MNRKAYNIAYMFKLLAEQAVEDANIINIKYVLAFGSKRDKFLIRNAQYWSEVVASFKRV